MSHYTTVACEMRDLLVVRTILECMGYNSACSCSTSVKPGSSSEPSKLYIAASSIGSQPDRLYWFPCIWDVSREIAVAKECHYSRLLPPLQVLTLPM